MTEYVPDSIKSTHDRWSIPEGVEVNTHSLSRNNLLGVRVFPKPVTEIAEERNGTRENNFPNTEFMIKRDNADTLIVMCGESWVYGGKHRDMVVGLNSDESPQSFSKACDSTVGSWLGYYLNADVHQSAWPGDHSSQIFINMERIVDHHVQHSNYKRIRVAVQVTDSHRDENFYSVYAGTQSHVPNMIERGNIGQTTTEWLAEYDLGFLLWAKRIKEKHPNTDIDIVVFKNFNPWVPTLEECKQTGVNFVEVDWTTFSADLEYFNLPVHKRVLNNASQLDPTLSELAKITSQTQEFREQQAECINSIYNYYQYSATRLGLLSNYPSTENHNLWALQICKAGGWEVEEFYF